MSVSSNKPAIFPILENGHYYPATGMISGLRGIIIQAVNGLVVFQPLRLLA